MENICANCKYPFEPNTKFCRKCGANLFEQINREQMNKIIVSTGDIKRDYEVIRPIHSYHHSLNNKERFGEKSLSVDDTIDAIIEEMKEEAKEEDCSYMKRK